MVVIRKASRATSVGRAAWRNNFNNNANANADDHNINNQNGLRGITQSAETLFFMTSPVDLWQELCSETNLELAFKKAKKHKTKKPYVIAFAAHAKDNLSLLRTELLLHAYKPKPLETFIIREPKTRKISKSDFQDRIVHHALCNIIESRFERTFIHDSYANRKGKGTRKAIRRFDFFKKKVTKNFTSQAFVLKADIRHYFDEIDHAILLKILQKKIKDPRICWLIKKVLSNYTTQKGKGMPLGNLTSQFFANVYLNELDQFVKHQLKVKYYLRYVDDFVILHTSKEELKQILREINNFLKEEISLQLHTTKTRIISLQMGTEFLGLKIFLRHKLIKQKNIRKFYKKLQELSEAYDHKKADYDSLYNFMEGWYAYAKNTDTHNLRNKIFSSFEAKFKNEISSKEINRYLKDMKSLSYLTQ